MPWGETQGPTIVKAAEDLAQAVRNWERSRTSNAEERLIEARRRFDRLMGVSA
jgi:hypothetical protein